MATYETHLPRIFAALSDPTRLAVVERLLDGPASVSELSQPFSMAPPSFLKHLRVLEEAGLVVSRKSGRVRTVGLVPDALAWVERWVLSHRARTEQRLDRLGAFLEQEQ
ncbi:MAG TPA: winged helix-turn-helix transcriptional regulator [Rhizobiales bacterium]|nr:winged helix-turn-helix transcriptional regulator [Hyphomicrobiales bacterium]